MTPVMANMIRRWRRAGAAAGAVLLIDCTDGVAPAAAKSFVLKITGAPGVRYTGRCTLQRAASDETIELAGVVPRHEEFTAQAIACRIASAGSITVEIAGGGSRGRAVANAGTAHLTMR
jgi:hypothetical protein